MAEDNRKISIRSYGATDEEFISPYMTSICGPLRVLDASMECQRRRDGAYNYVYSVRAEVKEKKEPLVEVAFVCGGDGQQRHEETAQFGPDTQLKEILCYFLTKNLKKAGGAIHTRAALLVDGDWRTSTPFAGATVKKTLKEVLPAGQHKLTIVAERPQPASTRGSSS